VHGFTGHPERTWTSKNGSLRQQNTANPENEEISKPAPKTGIFKVFSKSYSGKSDTLSDVYWPRDLVPITVPHARVLTFGYDSRVRHRLASEVDNGTVCDFAWDLLLALEGDRRADIFRPLLFVAHSLGGIVVKEMLRRAKTCLPGQAYLVSIFEATSAVIFFGTPHAGADPRTFLHKFVEKVVRVAQFTVEEQVVQTLLPTSERLKELRDLFGPMAQERDWMIHSFQEKFGVRALHNRQVCTA